MGQTNRVIFLLDAAIGVHLSTRHCQACDSSFQVLHKNYSVIEFQQINAWHTMTQEIGYWFPLILYKSSNWVFQMTVMVKLYNIAE